MSAHVSPPRLISGLSPLEKVPALVFAAAPGDPIVPAFYVTCRACASRVRALPMS